MWRDGAKPFHNLSDMAKTYPLKYKPRHCPNIPSFYKIALFRLRKNSCTVHQTTNRGTPNVHSLNKLFKTPVQVQRSMRLKRRVHVNSRILKNAFKQSKSCQWSNNAQCKCQKKLWAVGSTKIWKTITISMNQPWLLALLSMTAVLKNA